MCNRSGVALIALLSGACASSAPNLDEDHALIVQPGKWEFTHGGEGETEPYIFSECLADGRYTMSGVRDAYLMGASDEGCTYRETERTKTVFAFTDTCQAPEGVFSVEGRFESLGHVIHGSITAHMTGEGVHVLTYDGQRISECD